MVQPSNSNHENITSFTKVKINRLENKDFTRSNIEKLKFNRREDLVKVANFVLNNKDFILNKPREKLVLQEKIWEEKKRITNQTKGFISFFRNLFNPNFKNQKRQMALYLEELNLILSAIKEENIEIKNRTSEGSSSKTNQAQDQAKTTNTTSETTPPINHSDEGATAQEQVGDGDGPPPPPGSTNTETLPPGNTSTDEAGNENANDGPPPPPPLLNGTLGARKTPPSAEEILKRDQETWNKNENGRLEIERKARANPDTFYTFEAPIGEKYADLDETKRDLGKDINLLKEVVKKLPDQSYVTRLAYKEECLKETSTKLQGTRKCLKTYEQTKKPLSQYTNDELKVIIGMYFGGKAPDPNSDEYKVAYAPQLESIENTKDKKTAQSNNEKYVAMKEECDKIFNNWDVISNSDTAKEIFKHKDAWIQYLNLSKKNFFVETLAKRVLSNKATESGKPFQESHINYAKEPEHKPKPFPGKKPVKLPTGNNIGGGGGLNLSKIGDVKLTPREKQKPLNNNAPVKPDLFDEIKGGRPKLTPSAKQKPLAPLPKEQVSNLGVLDEIKKRNFTLKHVPPVKDKNPPIDDQIPPIDDPNKSQ